MEGCAILLGSATPSLESFHNAAARQIRTAPADAARGRQKMPFIRIVDMRMESKKAARSSANASSPRSTTGSEKASRPSSSSTAAASPPRSSAKSAATSASVRTAPSRLPFTAPPAASSATSAGTRPSRRRSARSAAIPASNTAAPAPRKSRTPSAKLFPHAVVKRMDADAMQRRDAYRETLGAFRTGQDRHPRRHADDRQGAAFSERHARRHRQRRPRPAPAGFPRRRTHLPAPHAGRRPRRSRRRRGRSLRAELHAVQPQRSSSRGITTSTAFGSRRSSSAASGTTRPSRTSCSSSSAPRISSAPSSPPKPSHRRLKDALPPNTTLSEPAPAPLEKSHGSYRFHLMLRTRAILRLSRALPRRARKTHLSRGRLRHRGRGCVSTSVTPPTSSEAEGESAIESVGRPPFRRRPATTLARDQLEGGSACGIAAHYFGKVAEYRDNIPP